VVLYNRVLETAEVEQINAELNAKYVAPEPATKAKIPPLHPALPSSNYP